MTEHTWRFMSLVFSFLILTILVALGSLLIMGSLDFSNWERDLLLNLGTETLGGALLFWMISLGWESYRSWTDSKATPLIDRQQIDDIYKLQMRVEVMSEQLVAISGYLTKLDDLTTLQSDVKRITGEMTNISAHLQDMNNNSNKAIH